MIKLWSRLKSWGVPARISAGAQAEKQAEVYLRQQGLRFIARNYLCRGGEIDLIFSDQQQLVFIEVRLRKNNRYGGAAASITHNKQRKINVAARHFMQKHDYQCHNVRFDTVCLDGDNNIQWLKAAFNESA